MWETGDLVVLFVTFSVILIAYFKWTFQYWKRRNVPYLEPKIPSGNLGRSGGGENEHLGVQLKRLYDAMREKGWKYGGIYALVRPVFLVCDLDTLKNIMTKDFKYFPDRGMYHNERADPISAHLFNISGVKWRNLRTKFTPTFTSGKMRTMFQTLVDCEVNMKRQIESQCEGKAPIDIKDLLGCYTTDVIGSCAFGLDCNTFEDNNSPFRVYGKKFLERSYARQVHRTFVITFPKLAYALNMSLLPRDVSNFFLKLVRDTVNFREKNNVNRKDFMQILIDLKNNKLTEDGYKHDGTSLTVEEIAAQSFAFFVAGFETSSTTMTFALYELSRNQDIQDKVREEIQSVLAKHGGKMTYDAAQEMNYLSQVIDESLRMYPPVALVPRRCHQDYKIPDSDIVIEKGTTVFIPILAIHHDKEYYPEPGKFDPDRFSDENKRKRHPYAHIPFGEGPKNCIGMRFGLMQSKVGLASLVKSFKFTVNPKTTEPLKMKQNSTVLAAKGEIWLNAHKI